jgi:heme exporter protein D
MFDYAEYIFWSYFLVLVPMLIVVIILHQKGKEIRNIIRKLK